MDDILGVIGATFLFRPRQQAPDQLVLTDLQVQGDVVFLRRTAAATRLVAWSGGPRTAST
jgi:hypothetical protein